jgi:phage repressor protein C with HTH and peptisase S24 domain
MLIEAPEPMVREESTSYGALGEFTHIPGLAVEDEAGREVQGAEQGEREKYVFRRQWLNSKGKVEDLVLIEARGDSMEPTIADGDAVLIDRSQKQVVVGNIYALRFKNAVMVKRLQPIDAARIKVMSDNRLYDSYEIDLETGDIEILGQVIWIGRELVR